MTGLEGVVTFANTERGPTGIFRLFFSDKTAQAKTASPSLPDSCPDKGHAEDCYHGASSPPRRSTAQTRKAEDKRRRAFFGSIDPEDVEEATEPQAAKRGAVGP